MYRDGRRVCDVVDLSDALAAGASDRGVVWLGLHEPTTDEFDDVAEELGLHPLAVEDAVHAHQRPKVELYGSSIFLVLKPARYVDSDEVVELGQIMLFVGSNFIVTVRHGSSMALAHVREELEADPERLAQGPLAVVHAIADRVVDDYAPVISGITVDVDEVEHAVFAGPSSAHAERIF